MYDSAMFRVARTHLNHPVARLDVAGALNDPMWGSVARCVLEATAYDLAGDKPEGDAPMPTVPESMTGDSALLKWLPWLWHGLGYVIPPGAIEKLAPVEVARLHALAAREREKERLGYLLEPAGAWEGLPEKVMLHNVPHPDSGFARSANLDTAPMSALARTLVLASRSVAPVAERIMLRTMVSMREQLLIERSPMVMEGAEVEAEWRDRLASVGIDWSKPSSELTSPWKAKLHAQEPLQGYVERAARALFDLGLLPLAVHPSIPEGIRRALFGTSSVSVAEAAEILGISVDAVRMALMRKKLPGTKQGSEWRISLADIEDYKATISRSK